MAIMVLALVIVVLFALVCYGAGAVGLLGAIGALRISRCERCGHLGVQLPAERHLSCAACRHRALLHPVVAFHHAHRER